MKMPVREERTGWRDQRISERHRLWGYNCPATDIDFLLLEYDTGKPAAIVEYKRDGAFKPNLKHSTYRAMSILADCAEIPFLIAFYWPKTWAFQVLPVNEYAKKHFALGENFSERDFVEQLYKLRRRTLPKTIENRLNTEYPLANSSYSFDEDDDNPFD